MKEQLVFSIRESSNNEVMISKNGGRKRAARFQREGELQQQMDQLLQRVDALQHQPIPHQQIAELRERFEEEVQRRVERDRHHALRHPKLGGRHGKKGEGHGSGVGEFNGPLYVGMNGDGHVVVVDGWNHRIQVIDRYSGFNCCSLCFMFHVV